MFHWQCIWAVQRSSVCAYSGEYIILSHRNSQYVWCINKRDLRCTYFFSNLKEYSADLILHFYKVGVLTKDRFKMNVQNPSSRGKIKIFWLLVSRVDLMWAISFPLLSGLLMLAIISTSKKSWSWLILFSKLGAHVHILEGVTRHHHIHHRYQIKKTIFCTKLSYLIKL